MALAPAAVLLGGTAACNDDDPVGPTGPTAGVLMVTLDTPNPDDGAILIVITGPGMSEIGSTNAAHYFRYALSGNTLTAVFVGDLEDGSLLEVRVPDVDALASYTATIHQVARRNSELRDSLAGYELALGEAS